MTKTSKKFSFILPLFLLSSSILTACSSPEKSMGDQTIESTKNQSTTPSSPPVSKDQTITYQLGAQGDSNYKKTTLTFKNNKLLTEDTVSNFPYANASVKMTLEETKQSIASNKASLKDVGGIDYDATIIPNEIMQTHFTIDYQQVDINKVSWLTSFTSETSVEDAVELFRQAGYKEIK